MPRYIYSIRDWDRHYENNRTRDLKAMTWVPIPIKFDGDGYTELINHPNGVAHYGVWIAIVGVAGRCAVRGTLLRDGDRPHDSGTLARITRIPEKMIGEAMERLVDIGWIERKPLPDNDPALPCGDPAPKCGETAAIPHPTDYGRKEGKEGREPRHENRGSAVLPPVESFPEADRPVVDAIRSSGIPTWVEDAKVVPAWVSNLRAIQPGIDVVHEVRKCATWWAANPGKVRDRRGCTKTLLRWLERASPGRTTGTANPQNHGPAGECCASCAVRGDSLPSAGNRAGKPLCTAHLLDYDSVHVGAK